ncbi:uncharacterized protein LOC117146669 [Drosophila mauritiana]|uniref:Uncharacterized protein LOC117146669 n=1 Tax=Drosophila mauritiana TaxID=7226 RepID=A0A6P8KP66_DROMA|nr:uncharacterized protein LOC117146669 [Drosophila mauritiana]
MQSKANIGIFWTELDKIRISAKNLAQLRTQFWGRKMQTAVRVEVKKPPRKNKIRDTSATEFSPRPPANNHNNHGKRAVSQAKTGCRRMPRLQTSDSILQTTQTRIFGMPNESENIHRAPRSQEELQVKLETDAVMVTRVRNKD